MSTNQYWRGCEQLRLHAVCCPPIQHLHRGNASASNNRATCTHTHQGKKYSLKRHAQDIHWAMWTTKVHWQFILGHIKIYITYTYRQAVFSTMSKSSAACKCWFHIGVIFYHNYHFQNTWKNKAMIRGRTLHTGRWRASLKYRLIFEAYLHCPS